MEYADCVDVVDMMPDLRPVTLNVKTAEGVFTSYVIGRARRKPLQKNLLATTAARIKQHSCIWQIWQVDLTRASAPAPKSGDRIAETTVTVSGSTTDTWVIDPDDDLELKLMRTVYNLPCTKIPT